MNTITLDYNLHPDQDDAEKRSSSNSDALLLLALNEGHYRGVIRPETTGILVDSNGQDNIHLDPQNLSNQNQNSMSGQNATNWYREVGYRNSSNNNDERDLAGGACGTDYQTEILDLSIHQREYKGQRDEMTPTQTGPKTTYFGSQPGPFGRRQRQQEGGSQINGQGWLSETRGTIEIADGLATLRSEMERIRREQQVLSAGRSNETMELQSIRTEIEKLKQEKELMELNSLRAEIENLKQGKIETTQLEMNRRRLQFEDSTPLNTTIGPGHYESRRTAHTGGTKGFNRHTTRDDSSSTDSEEQGQTRTQDDSEIELEEQLQLRRERKAHFLRKAQQLSPRDSHGQTVRRSADQTIHWGDSDKQDAASGSRGRTLQRPRNTHQERSDNSTERVQIYRGAQQRETTRKSPLKLERFDGTTPLEIFLLQFDNCAQHNGWGQDEKQAQLKGALKGTAAQVLMGSQGALISYQELRHELGKCFGNEGNTAQYRSILKMKRRAPGESLRTLYQDVSRLLMLAYPGPHSELRDQLAIEAFVDSLDDLQFAIDIKDRSPKDLAEAFQTALRLESNRLSTRRDIDREFRDKKERPRGHRNDLESRRVEADSDENDSTKRRLMTRQQREKETEDAADLHLLKRKIEEIEMDVRRSREEPRRDNRTSECAAVALQMQRSESGETAQLKQQVQMLQENQNRLEGKLKKQKEKQQRSNVASAELVPPPATERKTVQFHNNPQRADPRIENDSKKCFLCLSPGHFMDQCPNAICRNCGRNGHTHKRCKERANTSSRPPPGPCPACGDPTHWKRDCPNSNRSSVRSVERRFRSQVVHLQGSGVNEIQAGQRNRAYVDMKCMGKTHRFLLDSGCDVTLLPAKYVRGIKLEPTDRRAYAANNTEIDLLGEATVDMRIGDITIPTTAIISDNVEEGLIGYDWLSNNNVFWGFGMGKIMIRGEIVPLFPRKTTGVMCNRIVVQEAYTVPAQSEAIITAKVMVSMDSVMCSRDACVSNFMIEPSVRDSGLLVGAALLPSRCHNIPTRVVNTSCRSLRLEEGDELGELQTLREEDVLDLPGVDITAAKDVHWKNEILSQIHDSVTSREKDQLEKILSDYSDCFSQSEADLGRTEVVKHRIDTGNSRPVKQILRRHPPVHIEEIDRHVQEMLSQDVIEVSQSPWSSNVVIVKKKDGSMRFCIDYRRLNDVTVKDSYPLPRINDCLDALGTGRYFSAFDLRSGYFQVAMEDEDKPKTSFVTRSGLYQFKVMPFGVTNGPATFQRLMDLTMAGLNYRICLVYLDDIILMSNTVEEHLERLILILDRLRQAGLKLKPSKCKLLQKTITFLGHVVSEKGVSTDPSKIVAVQEWPIPINVTEVRSFIGLCSYYRRFVQDFAAVAGPLHALTGKRVPFKWTTACQEAFEELKNRLTSAPILAMPQDDQPYRLDTDASNDAIGAVLSQVQDGQERVVAYASRLLNKSEKNYCVTRRELLAVVFFIKQFRNYLLGRKFLIRTDHAALRWLRNMAEPIGQQARWLASMEEYEFDIEHRPGKKHANADAMSRRPCRQCHMEEEAASILSVRADEFVPDSTVVNNLTNQTAVIHPDSNNIGTINKVPKLRTLVINEEEFNPVEYFCPERLSQDYINDSKLSTFYSLFEQDKERPEWNEVIGMDRITKSLWHQWYRFAKVEGVLYRQWVTEDQLQERWQLVPPSSIRQQMMNTAHTGMTGGHLGTRRTMGQLQLRAFWPGWQRDVKRYCGQCGECATYHRGVLKRQGHLQSFPVGEPLERLAIDLTGPHPTSSSGHVYILTAVDLFTKWAEAVPLRNKEAVTVARALVDVVISRLGIPLQILSDNGKEFDNSIMKELCRLLGIDKLRTTVYKASTNGAVERFHRTLNSMLGKVVSTNQRNWDEWLPSVVAAYRASRHDATGYSPNFMMFGREVYAPLDIMYGAPTGEEKHYDSYDDFVDRKIETMRKAYQLAREHLGYAANRSKKLYDMRVRPKLYQVGQWVYYYCPRKFTGRSPKWQRMYTGPFLIIKEMGPVNMQLQASPRAKPFICHIDKLKACLGTTPKAWVRLGTDGRVETEEPVNLAENDVVKDLERIEEDHGETSQLIEEQDPESTPEPVLEQRQQNGRPKRDVGRPQRFRDFV